MSGSRKSFTRTRTRRTPDFSRIREAVSGPGIDTRIWIAPARVDMDEDAVVWDEQLGWLADVTFTGLGLSGEGPVLCRCATDAQGNGFGRYRPPRPGCLVQVVINEGDLNAVPVIVGQLNDADCVAPTTVNGDAIVERDAGDGEVAAAETHLAVFPQEDVDEEWRAVRRTASGAHRLHGDSMELGVDGADQPFARGNDLADALDDVIGAIGAFAEAIATAAPAPPNAALTVANVLAAQELLAPAIQAFQNARANYLSTRIKGD